jgi:uroporphyrin-3 C-methyltransferase
MLLYVIIFILLLIIIVGGYYFNMNKQYFKRYDQQLKNQISANQQQLAQQRIQLQQLNVQQAQVSTQIKQHGFSNEEWILSSAKYFIQQAQLKLTVEHDVPTALALLQTAERRVSSVNSLSLNRLAAAINKDITDLQAINVVDLDMLGKQFNLLTKNISTLALGLITQQPQTVPTVDTTDKGWKKAFYKGLHALRNVVVVQRTDRKFTPLLQQQQLASFKQYLQNLAQQAFWGALNDEAGLYHQNLTAIGTSLQQYILPSNKNSQLIQAQLLQLQKLKVAPLLPPQLSAAIVAKNLQMKDAIIIQGNVK